VVKLTHAPPILKDQIGQAFIIAYREQTDRLQTVLRQEGFRCEVLRQCASEHRQGDSPSYRTLLNHRRAWEQAAQASQPTLVVEADFVPVTGFGQLPLPFPPDQNHVGIAWLYTCAPQLYSVCKDGYAEGYSSSMVAYVVTPESAPALIELADEIHQTIGPGAYSTWDSGIDPFLRSRGFKNFIPFRNYGEHGGRPNPEHYKHGLSRVHRADVLYGKLAFMPLYALSTSDDLKSESSSSGESMGDRLRLWGARSQARLKGLARLASGKYLRFKVVRRSSVPIWLLSFAVRRHGSMRL
jgi:hypothetical protein